MATTPEQMMNAMMKNIESKTGHNINYWLKIAKASGETKHMAIIKFLKTNHGMSHGYANLIAFKIREDGSPKKTENQLIEDQYSKKPEIKPEIKPIYDELSEYILNLNPDISKRVCKGYVAFKTTKQFAILKPSTKTRMDLGLMLKGNEMTPRLKDGKKFSGMMTHHVEVFTKENIDNELKNWLEQAYQMAKK